MNSEMSGYQTQLSDPIKLQFFYDNGIVAGFGWLNNTMFCYGQYSFDTNSDSNAKVKVEDLVLKSQNLKRMEYLKKEGD